MVSTVGTSFTASTVTVNDLTVLALSLFVARLPSNPPSVTVTVIRVLPDASANGVNLNDPVVSGVV